jgi:hypothetical protein
MARAAEKGLTVTKPWGESARYDVAVERGGVFVRVQVKSTAYRVGRAYVCNVRSDNRLHPYTERQIDYLAAYVIPEDVWYILPARVAVALKGNIWLSPLKPGHKYERYKEAWELLCGASKRKRARGVTLHAVVEDSARDEMANCGHRTECTFGGE